MDEHGERIAVLESEIEGMRVELAAHYKRDEDNQREVIRRLDEMALAAAKQKGFIGGVVLVVSAIVTALGLLFKYFGK